MGHLARRRIDSQDHFDGVGDDAPLHGAKDATMAVIALCTTRPRSSDRTQRTNARKKRSRSLRGSGLSPRRTTSARVVTSAGSAIAFR